MGSPVLYQISNARKTRAAALAQVRLNPRVQTAVRNQTFPVRERLGTVQTLERLLPRVAPLVYLQLPFPPEALPAEFAQELFLGIVDAHVRPTRVDGAEALSAHLTLEAGPLAAVVLLVMHQ